MSKIIAAVPNICEGKNQRLIDDLVARLKDVASLILLDVDVDHGRNRTVFSFTGTKEAIFEAGFILYEQSLQHIDMRKHEGEHPRVGAVDVFPFVPLKNATIDEAKAWAAEFAEHVATRFKLPVYLYGESARYRYRRDITNIRQGEYEGFAEKMKDVRWRPDLGPDHFPPDSGATIIGARFPAVQFKVYFDTRDETIADAVGLAVTEMSGGIVHAYPSLDLDRGLAMLTMTISNFKASPLYRTIENLKIEGARFGVGIRRVEIIGLIPEIVLIDAAEYYLRIQGFDNNQLLERNIQSHLSEEFIFGD